MKKDCHWRVLLRLQIFRLVLLRLLALFVVLLAVIAFTHDISLFTSMIDLWQVIA
jgi:hypothetical protein